MEENVFQVQCNPANKESKRNRNTLVKLLFLKGESQTANNELVVRPGLMSGAGGTATWKTNVGLLDCTPDPLIRLGSATSAIDWNRTQL